MMRPGAATEILRVLSTILFVLALLGATMIVALDLLHVFQPTLLNWHLKSGFPLILVGSALLLLQLTLLRKPAKLFLAISVSMAFILWGTEQFLQNPAIVSFIDDLVVLLFVIDLSIVIRGYLKREIDSPVLVKRLINITLPNGDIRN